MIYLQLLSSYSSRDNGFIFGPYDDIQVDWHTIRMFDGISDRCDSIDKMQDGDHESPYWYYKGGGFPCLRLVKDPRIIWKKSNPRVPLIQYNKKDAQ